MSEIINERDLDKAVGGSAAGAAWNQGGMTYYRIEYGDTLFDIAMRFNTTCENIQALNPGLIKNIDRIQEGWEIRVL